MNFLFVHRDFPGQFGALATRLAQSTHHRVVFINSTTAESAEIDLRRYRPKRAPARTTHHYLHNFESGVLNGQAVYEICHKLQAESFTPDVIFAHCGWGTALYLREAFPLARLIGYFEWYYHPHGSDADYLDPAAMTADNACRIRTLNAPLLMMLEDVDLGLVPTAFQHNTFPHSYRHKLRILHDGVDTDYFVPDSAASRRFVAADLTKVKRLLTYATRGMEPYRGFPEFMQAIDGVLRVDRHVHVAIAGEDRTYYSRPLPGGDTYKAKALRELPGLDLTRVHFLGTLPRDDYRRLLQISDLHVYLTVPFVPSWSLVEAMACGCHILASDTNPTREILGTDICAHFTDHRDTFAFEKVLLRALQADNDSSELRRRARKRAESAYSIKSLLPRWEEIAIGAREAKRV
ncbi:glycosyltransferase [Dongia sp.]|uniref:glycosyltransferase n=1 Tax=Dongia sp. TaxID=1977262 RepID=UPI0035AE01D1